MNIRQILRGLQFHVDGLLNNEIQSVLTHLSVAIKNLYPFLPFVLDTCQVEVAGKRRFINRLEKSRSKGLVNRDGSANDPSG